MIQPVVAAGNVSTPEEAVPPVPTLTVKAAVPLAAMTGEVPKPLETVGAVALIRATLLMLKAPDDVVVKISARSVVFAVSSASTTSMPLPFRLKAGKLLVDPPNIRRPTSVPALLVIINT